MKRTTAALLALALILPVAGCAESEEDKQRDTLGIALDKGKWNEGENKMTEDGAPYAVVGTGKIKCYAKFGLVPGTGDRPQDVVESASFTLVGVTADFDGNGLVPLAELPEELKSKATALSKDDFVAIVELTRDASPKLKPICGDLPK